MEHGAAWNTSTGLSGQAHWREHAQFMDALVDDGFVVLGGPFGDGRRVLLVVVARDEAVVRARLAPDPWMVKDLLQLTSVEPWELRLGRLPTTPG